MYFRLGRCTNQVFSSELIVGIMKAQKEKKEIEKFLAEFAQRIIEDYENKQNDPKDIGF